MPVSQAIGQVGGIDAAQAGPFRLQGGGLQSGQAQQALSGVVLEASGPQPLAFDLVQRQVDLTQFHAIPVDIGLVGSGAKVGLHTIEPQLSDRAATIGLQLGGLQLSQVNLPARQVDLGRPGGQLPRLALSNIGAG